MQVCDGVGPLPLVFRASSLRDTFAAAEQCTATHLEPLSPSIAKHGDGVFITRMSKVTAVGRESTDDV